MKALTVHPGTYQPWAGWVHATREKKETSLTGERLTSLISWGPVESSERGVASRLCESGLRMQTKEPGPWPAASSYHIIRARGVDDQSIAQFLLGTINGSPTHATLKWEQNGFWLFSVHPPPPLWHHKTNSGMLICDYPRAFWFSKVNYQCYVLEEQRREVPVIYSFICINAWTVSWKSTEPIVIQFI